MSEEPAQSHSGSTRNRPYSLATRDEWTGGMDDAYSGRVTEDGRPQIVQEYIDSDEYGVRDPLLVGRSIRWLVQRTHASGDEGEKSGLEHLKSSPHWNSMFQDSILKSDLRRMANSDEAKLFLDKRAERVQVYGKAVDSLFPRLGGIIQQGIAEGRQRGYVPESIDEERVDGAIKSLIVRVTDPAVRKASDTLGEYGIYDDTITMMTTGKSKFLPVTMVHEIRHRLSGGTFREDKKEGSIERTRVGLASWQEKKREWAHTSIDEAINEHVTQSILYGHWGKLDPYKRPNTNTGIGAYAVDRQFLARLIDSSQGIISLKTVVRASFEDTHGGGGVTERRAMMREFRKAYDPGTLRAYGRMMKKINEHNELHGRVPSRAMDAIIPPSIDKDGKVHDTGYIDMGYLESVLENDRLGTPYDQGDESIPGEVLIK